jgi:nicotinamidase-related amidase
MLNRQKSCLVLIDVQEKLAAVMHESARMVSNCAILLQIARALEIPIVWCQQYPKAIGPTVEPLLVHLEGVTPMDKLCFSCCGQPAFLAALEQREIETAILCGIESHVCVFQTAMELMQKGLYVHVIADAVASRTPENKQIGLSRMAAAGAVISSTEMLLFELLRTAEHPQFKALSRLIR